MPGAASRVRTAPVGHAWLSKPYRVLDLINALRVVQQVSRGVPVTAPIPSELRLLR